MKKKTTKKTIIIISVIVVLLIALITGVAIYSYNEDLKRTALIEEQTIAATEQALDAITEKMKLIEDRKDSFTPEQQTTYEAIKAEVDQLTKDTTMDKIQQLGTKVYSFHNELEDSQ